MSPALVFDTLLEASGRALLIAGSAALVIVILRTKAPALRHAVWTAALATMLVLPLMSGWLPTIQIPLWLPSPVMGLTTAISAPVPDEPARPGVSAASQSASPALTSTAVTPALSRSLSAAPSPTMATTSRGQDWRLNAVFVWLVVAGVMLVREVVGWRLARRLASQSVPAAIGDGTYVSDRVSTPVVTGLLQPRVLVPSSWSQWGSGVRRMVLAHERAHVVRRDPLVALLSRVNRAVFWFHPLAWWMERHLSRLAERACDEVVVRALKDSRLYAGLLVEMAHRLQRHGRRVAWQGIGIISSRSFEDRLDRILQGPAPDSSPRAKIVLATACAVLMAIGVACGTGVAPLAENPDLAKDLAAREARTAEYQAAVAMTLDQVRGVERVVAGNPDDLDATRNVLTFYRESGQKLMGWNEMVAARRPHLLRLIARHPESDLTHWPFAARLDPEGYEQARTLWFAHVTRPGVSARVLGQAAAFFEISERREAEQLLLRAYALDPDGPQPRVANGVYHAPWQNRLGVLYAKAIVGSDDETLFNVVKSVNAAEAKGPFAQHARNELAKTTSSVLLASAGAYLVVNANYVKLDFDHRALGLSHLERAVTLEPVSPLAVWSLKQANRILTHDKDYQRVVEQLGKPVFDLDPSGFDRLSEEIKAVRGHDLLWAPYGEAMRAYQKPDPAAVNAALAEFRRRADALEQTARKATVPPDVAARLTTDVHLALAIHAMRMGNRTEAVRRLGIAASSASPSTTKGNAAGEEGMAQYKAIELTYELLTAGERESVAQYYDAIAKMTGEDQRKIYEPAASAIRAGRMPENYQRYLARNKVADVGDKK